MRGVININKPAGLSSYDVIRRLKPRLKPNKIGHAGTLDPIATGVLLILLEEATKISQVLISLPKEYKAEMTLGIATDTDDITGNTIATAPVPDISADAFRNLLRERFTGTILQTPPRFSALKKEGTPLYRFARQGMEITPPARRVSVYELELVEWQPPKARLRMVVSSGTYVRALCRDIGQALGSCATLSALTRLRIGRFTIAESVTPERLLNPDTDWQRLVVPIERALEFLPWMLISDTEVNALLQGKIVPHPGGDLPPGTAIAHNQNNTFLALVRTDHQQLKPERVIYAD